MGANWSAGEDRNRRLLRARDVMDREFAERLDLAALAGVAYMSEGYFSRSFREAFGETPHRYLQRRRIERAMALLRDPASSVTEVGLQAGFESLGAFSRAFRAIVGVSPSQYRDRKLVTAAPGCFVRTWLRPADLDEAPAPTGFGKATAPTGSGGAPAPAGFSDAAAPAGSGEAPAPDGFGEAAALVSFGEAFAAGAAVR